MSPEGRYEILLMRLQDAGLMDLSERRRLAASFRQALLARDVAVIEQYLYGDEPVGYGGTEGSPDEAPEVVRLTAGARARLGL